MTVIKAKLERPTGVDVTMEITMTLSGWLRLRDDLDGCLKTKPGPTNSDSEILVEAIDALAVKLQDPVTLYFSPGMATVKCEPNQEEKKDALEN